MLLERLIKRWVFTIMLSHILLDRGLSELWAHPLFFFDDSRQGSRALALSIVLLWSWYDERRSQKELCKASEEIESTHRHHDTATAVMKLVCAYDPENNEAMRRFRPVRRNSKCLFANVARLWGSRDSIEGESLEEHVKASVPMLLQMLLRSEAEGFDGFVFEVRGDHGKNVKTFAAAVRRVLETISDMDPNGERSARKQYIADRAWHFVFAGYPIFVTTMAPCYGNTSSRYAYGADEKSSFVLLQPESSFLRHDLPPDTPNTIWQGPAMTVRDRIRRSFRDAGQAYIIPPTVSYPASEHIVKALQDEKGNVVKWWEAF
jgi:hypothetical protein